MVRSTHYIDITNIVTGSATANRFVDQSIAADGKFTPLFRLRGSWMCLIRPQSRALLDSSIFATFKCVLYRNGTDEDDWPNMKANFLHESLKRTQQEDAIFVISLAPASQFHEMKNLFLGIYFIKNR
jgi:hypothetical protein